MSTRPIGRLTSDPRSARHRAHVPVRLTEPYQLIQQRDLAVRRVLLAAAGGVPPVIQALRPIGASTC